MNSAIFEKEIIQDAIEDRELESKRQMWLEKASHISGNKIVLNGCYGGFSVSKEFESLWDEITGEVSGTYRVWESERQNPLFIAMVDELGSDANSDHSFLHVVEVPETATDWVMREYDGVEEILYVENGKIKCI